MKYAILLTCLALITSIVLPGLAADNAGQQGNDRKGNLRHVVALKFKEGTTEPQIREVEEAFRALKKKIPAIHALEWGTNNSPESHDKGFTHCFILTFQSEKARADYLPHPDHKAFGRVLGPVLEDVFVIDYWAKE
jgi:hypothetical protein